MRDQELHQSDVLLAAATLACHHRIDEERHHVDGVAHHAPAERSHAAVLAFFDSRFVGRGESLDLNGSDADAGTELDDAGADEVVLLAGLELALDIFEKGVPENAAIPERVGEFTGAHFEDRVAVAPAALEDAELPAAVGAQLQSSLRLTPDRAFVGSDEIAKLALERHGRDEAPAVAVE